MPNNGGAQDTLDDGYPSNQGNTGGAANQSGSNNNDNDAGSGPGGPSGGVVGGSIDHHRKNGDGGGNDDLGNSPAEVRASLRRLGYSPSQINRIIRNMFGGGDGGGSSSGGGGGGSSGPSMSPEESMQRNALQNVYMRLWGEVAPKAVIDQAFHSGMNVYQFEDQQRNDPSFRKTETYQNEYADKALGLARELGFL